MFKCSNCGYLFEAGEWEEWEENGGEIWHACPVCKDTDFDEINPCKICGSYDHNIYEDYCDDCKHDVQSRFQTFLNMSFDEEERKLLNELYDGEEL